MEPKLTWRRRVAVVALVLPLLALAAGAAAQNATSGTVWTPPDAATGEAPKIDVTLKDHLDALVGTFRYDSDFFPNQVVVLSHRDGHFFAQLTGGPVTEVIVRENGDFIFNNRHLAPRNADIVNGQVNALDISWRSRTVRLVRVADTEAAHMEDLHMQRLAEQVEPRTIVSTDPKTLDDYVGYYKLSDNTALSITREGGHLFNKVTGEDRIEIFPYADRSFFYTTSAMQLTFEPDSDGHINMAVEHWDGWVYHAPRITEAEGKTINDAYQDRLDSERKPRTAAAIDAAQFDKYVGSYQLNPRTIMKATREGDKFFMQLTNQRKYQIYPENDHTFFYTVVAAQVSFETDADGRTTKLVLHQNGWDSPAERLDTAAK